MDSSASTTSTDLAVAILGDASLTVISIAGRLDADSFPSAWEQMVDPLEAAAPKRLQVNLAKLDYCDGAGLGVLAEVRRRVVATGGAFELVDVPETHRRLLGMSQLVDPTAATLRPPPRPGMVVSAGAAADEIIGDIREIITFIGQLLSTGWWMLRHPHRLRWRDMLSTAEKAGADAAPVV